MQFAILNAHRSAKSQIAGLTPRLETQKVRVVVAVRPEASVTVSVIVPRSNSLMVNEVVGDGVIRSGFPDVQAKSHV